jgi:RimJ/RimL family protein N-acetyltransferase
LDRIKENPAIEKADLAVGAENKGAIALYRSLGFVQYGEYANALKVDGEYVDELYMTLALKSEKIR